MVDGSNHTQSGDHCGSETTTTTTGQDITVKCQPPGLGRFLTIATKQPKSVLSLCDVKISGYEFVGKAKLFFFSFEGNPLSYSFKCDVYWTYLHMDKTNIAQ